MESTSARLQIIEDNHMSGCQVSQQRPPGNMPTRHDIVINVTRSFSRIEVSEYLYISTAAWTDANIKSLH